MKRYFPIILCFLTMNFNCYYHHKIIKTYPLDSFTTLTSGSLASKRIVMLGDNDHGNECFENMVIDVLNAWLDTLERNPHNPMAPKKMFLILEADSLVISHTWIDAGYWELELKNLTGYEPEKHVKTAAR